MYFSSRNSLTPVVDRVCSETLTGAQRSSAHRKPQLIVIGCSLKTMFDCQRKHIFKRYKIARNCSVKPHLEAMRTYLLSSSFSKHHLKHQQFGASAVQIHEYIHHVNHSVFSLVKAPPFSLINVIGLSLAWPVNSNYSIANLVELFVSFLTERSHDLYYEFAKSNWTIDYRMMRPMRQNTFLKKQLGR